MERRRASTASSGVAGNGGRSRANTMLPGDAISSANAAGGNHRVSNFGQFRYDYEAAQQQMSETAMGGKRGSTATALSALDPHAHVSQALTLMRDINWNTKGAQVVHSSAEEYTSIRVSSVEEIKRSVKSGTSSRTAEKANRDYVVPEVDLTPKYVRPMTASAVLLEEVVEIERQRRALESRKSSALRKSSSFGGMRRDKALGEVRDEFGDSTFPLQRASVTAEAPRTHRLLSSGSAGIGALPRPHTSMGLSEGGGDLYDGSLEQDAAALIDSLSVSSRTSPLPPAPKTAAGGARGRVVLPSMSPPSAGASGKRKTKKNEGKHAGSSASSSHHHHHHKQHHQNVDDAGSVGSRRSNHLDGGLASANSSVCTASTGSGSKGRKTNTNTNTSGAGGRRSRAASNASTHPQQQHAHSNGPSATLGSPHGSSSSHAPGSDDANTGTGAGSGTTTTATGAAASAGASTAATLVPPIHAHASDASRSVDALRKIDEKAARIQARQLQIETRAQQTAWLKVVAVLTRASVLVDVVLKGRSADSSQRALKAGQRVASKMARWLNLARLRILQRRSPMLFKVLRSCLLRYRVRVFVKKTRAQTALIKLFLRDTEAVNARVMKMKSFRYHIMKIQKYIRGYLEIQRQRQQLLRLALDRMVCGRLLQYKRDKAKHEVDSIASLRAVREWSTSVTRLEKAGTGIQGMLQHTINLVAKRRRFMQDACIHGLDENEYSGSSSNGNSNGNGNGNSGGSAKPSPDNMNDASGAVDSGAAAVNAVSNSSNKGAKSAFQVKDGGGDGSSDGSGSDDDSVDSNNARGMGRRGKGAGGGASRPSTRSHGGGGGSRAGTAAGGSRGGTSQPPLVSASTPGYPGASVFFQGSVRSFRPRYTSKMIGRDLVVIVTNQRKRHCLAVAEAEMKSKKTRSVDDAAVSTRARAFLLTAGDLGPVEDVEALNRRRKFNHRSTPFLLLTAGALLELEHVAAAVLRCYIEAEEAHEKKVQGIMRSERERQELEQRRQQRAAEEVGAVVKQEAWPEPQRGYVSSNTASAVAGVNPLEVNAALARQSSRPIAAAGAAASGAASGTGLSSNPTPSASPFISPR